MKNIFSRLKKIDDNMKQRGFNTRVFTFANGQIYEMPENRIWPMFHDLINKKPNNDVDFFRKQLEADNPDTNGMVYALEPYFTDITELFADELDNSKIE